METIQSESSRSKSKASLSTMFYRDLDTSKLLRDLERLGSLESLGMGTHFTSYFWKPSSFSYALSVSRDTFYKGDSWGRSKWAEAMEKVQKLKHPLIPPMLHGVYNEKVYYLKPYCPDRVDVKDPLIRDQILSLESALSQENLKIDDYWQVRSLDQHPFVIDWSDLVLDNL